MSRAQEILTAAAARVERDGLNKGGYYEGYGDSQDVTSFDTAHEILNEGKTPAVDVYGALHLETQSEQERVLVSGLVERAFGVNILDVIFAEVHPVVAWNDAPETTAAEVAELLRKAAELAA